MRSLPALSDSNAESRAGSGHQSDISRMTPIADPAVKNLATITAGEVNSLVSSDGAGCGTADATGLIGLFTVAGLDLCGAPEIGTL
jgi:hypothetical protein